MAKSLERKRSWRSLLFVPGDSPRLIEKAASKYADAIILDLEDSVVPENKEKARSVVASYARDLGNRIDVLVRVNGDPLELQNDVCTLSKWVRAVVLPKVDKLEQAVHLGEALARCERDLDIELGSIGILALIESPIAIPDLFAIARDLRVVGLALGTEDFANAMRIQPSRESLQLPAQLICMAAASENKMGLAIPASITDFRDLEAWKLAALNAKSFGATGGVCIHPAQASILNEVFSPTSSDYDWAEKVLGAWGRRDGVNDGVTAVDGMMIDRPILERARAILAMRTQMNI